MRGLPPFDFDESLDGVVVVVAVAVAVAAAVNAIDGEGAGACVLGVEAPDSIFFLWWWL